MHQNKIPEPKLLGLYDIFVKLYDRRIVSNLPKILENQKIPNFQDDT